MRIHKPELKVLDADEPDGEPFEGHHLQQRSQPGLIANARPIGDLDIGELPSTSNLFRKTVESGEPRENLPQFGRAFDSTCVLSTVVNVELQPNCHIDGFAPSCV